MAKTTVYTKTKRLEKLTKKQEEDLTFDLINAFSIVKTSTDSALLLQDLLTKKEIKNLAKRLRIAKLLKSGKKQEGITKELHCSFATVSKVKTWLDEGGMGLEKVINRLPQRVSKPTIPHTYPSPNLPSILIATIQEIGYSNQKKKIDKFLTKLEEKRLISKQIKESVTEEFRNLYNKTKKQEFIKSTSLHRTVNSTTLHRSEKERE